MHPLVNMSITEDIAYVMKHLLEGNDRYMEEEYYSAMISFSDGINFNTRDLIREEKEYYKENRHRYSNQIYHLHYKCLLHRAMAYQKLQMYDEALIDITEAVETMEQELREENNKCNRFSHVPEFTDHDVLFCYRICGWIHYEMKQYNDGIIAFTKAVQRWKLMEQESSGINEKIYTLSYYQNFIDQWTRVQLDVLNDDNQGVAE